MTTTIIAVALLLVGAGAWDLYVIRRWGFESGKTLSWELYSASKKTPAIAFGGGVLTCWVLVSSGVNPVFALYFVVVGHIFLTMHGA